jgi:DNA-binding transcriptional ArsR family regulator
VSVAQLNATFSALADPTRRAILARLLAGETTVTELAAPFAMTLSAITKHLKVLESAQLIERSRRAQWRPCRLNPEPLSDIANWVEPYRKLWDQRFDRLTAYLHELQNEEGHRDEI